MTTNHSNILQVQYAKDFTVLPALDDSDWNEECCEVIRSFFRDPSKLILTIFYDVDALKASLEFPNNAIEGLTYFYRSPWQVYSPDNFHATVSFGSVTGNVENCVLKVIENVYAFGIFSSNHWPSGILINPQCSIETRSSTVFF